jgi:hypothetical protein
MSTWGYRSSKVSISFCPGLSHSGGKQADSFVGYYGMDLLSKAGPGGSNPYFGF